MATELPPPSYSPVMMTMPCRNSIMLWHEYLSVCKITHGRIGWIFIILKRLVPIERERDVECIIINYTASSDRGVNETGHEILSLLLD